MADFLACIAAYITIPVVIFTPGRAINHPVVISYFFGLHKFLLHALKS